MMNVFYVALGGALGASLRYGAGYTFGSGAQATLFVNVFGSLLLGLLTGWLTSRDPAGQSTLYLFIGVGILGAFTTFSAFSRETVHFFMNGDVLRGAIYAMANMTGAIAAFAVGLFLLRKVLA
ncbi:MAG: CrcB family protein [Pseudomonadota bacterium]